MTDTTTPPAEPCAEVPGPAPEPHCTSWVARCLAVAGGRARVLSQDEAVPDDIDDGVVTIVLVESPGQRLARWVDAGEPGLPSQALAAWSAEAAAWLRHAHRAPGRCLLLVASEAMAAPAAACAAVGRHLGLEVAAHGVLPAQPVVDALVDSAAGAMLAAQPSAGALWDELRDSCLPLTMDPAPVAAEAADAAAALVALRRLRQQTGDRVAQASSAQAEVEQAAQALCGLEAAAAAAREDAQLLQMQLEQALEELDAVQQRAAGEGAALRAELGALQADGEVERRRIRLELAEVQARAAQERITLHQDLERERASAAQALDAARARAEQVLRDEMQRQRSEFEQSLAAAQARAAQEQDALRHELRRQQSEFDQSRAVLVAECEAARAALHAAAETSAGDKHLHQTLQRELRAALDSELVRHQQLSAVLAAQKSTLEEALSQARAARTELAGRDQRIEELRRDLAALQRACELLEAERVQAQLHIQLQAEHAMAAADRGAEALALAQAQGEQLEAMRAELREARRLLALGVTAGPEGGEVVLDGMDIVEVRAAPPYLELCLRCSGIETPTGRHAALDLRLVEHRGHPGLVVFSGEGVPPLADWQPDGDEHGRPLMALIPANAGPGSSLQRMASADWRFVHGLARLLEREMAHGELADAAAWHGIAARLRAQLAALPARLRYNRLQVFGTGDSLLEVLFEDVVFDHLSLPEIRLQWQRNPAGGSWPLQWLRPAPTAALPLAGWPGTEGGALAAVMPLAVGPGLSDGDKRRWWAELPGADRALVLAVLDALPAVARGAADGTLAEAAAALHRDARRTLAALRLRDTARRIARRATHRG